MFNIIFHFFLQRFDAKWITPKIRFIRLSEQILYNDKKPRGHNVAAFLNRSRRFVRYKFLPKTNVY